jgi:hypothetical protein
MTPLRKGGYPRSTVCSNWGASDVTTRRISSTLLPGVTVVIGNPFAARWRQHAAVYMPPTQVPSAKQTTASVRRSSARKLSQKTCSNRAATRTSSRTERGHTVGSPDEPDETATMSALSSVPCLHRSASGWRRR